MIVLRPSSRQVEELLSAYGDEVQRAIPRALNRAGTTMRAVMARGISKDLGLKVGDIRERLKLEKATRDQHVVRVWVSGKRIPLIEFGAKGPPIPSRGRGAGISYKLPGSPGRHPHAFFAVVGAGHKGVFVRVLSRVRRGPPPNRSQLPIRELKGPSLPKVFAKLTPEALAAGEASLIKNLQSELRFATSGGQ